MGDIAQRGNRLTQKRNKASKEMFKLAQGKRIGKFGGGRTNLLEELGRVEAEPSNRNRRAEISRVHGELNRGYAKGGRVGLKKGGKPWGTGPKPGSHEFLMQNLHKRKGKAAGGAMTDTMTGGKRAAKTFIEKVGGSEKGKPHSTKEGRIASGKRKIKRFFRSRALKPKKTWPPKHSDLLRRYPKVPQPHKSPGDTPYIPRPKYTPGEPKIMQPAAKGGRIGLKKGGSDKNWIQKAVNPKHKGYCTPMTKKTCTPARKALARTFKKKAKTGW